VQKARQQVRRWYADGDGKVVLALGYIDGADPVMYRVDGRRLVDYDGPEWTSEIPPAPLGFSADGERVFMNMTNGTDRHGIYSVRYEDGAVLGPVYTDAQFDVFATLVQDPDSGEPTGLLYLGHHPRMVWFDPDVGALFDSIRAALPGRELGIVTNDARYRRFVLRSYGGIVPRFYLYDRTSGRTRLIGREYDGLDDATIVDLEPVSYPTRDGSAIPAYLAVPRDRPARKLPTILFPHGGPYARDSAEFDYWTQFFVDRGYAVLKPNYRGSIGYGEYFMRSGYRQWGLRMQEDLLDGLDWLIARGIADPDRVCVVGASFGGYSALVAAYKNSDRIRCAVSLAGITDLEKLVQRIQSFDLMERNLERIQSGRALRENSPVHQAENFAVPVLIVHGGQDTVVRTRQSRDLAELLRQLDKPVEYIEQPDGDHFLSGRRERVQFFDAMGRFLDRHLAPGG
jgi:acetyl esterase/lipase